jgi:gamma-glutamylcyclotransferase (GGCT)/AIG2-like uncharacterized protein YtfP
MHVVMPRTLLFVYGTLMRDERNHGVLVGGGGATFVRHASTRAEFALLDLGDHPAMVRGDTSVEGELWSIEDAATMAAVEALEEAPDHYHRIPLTLADGTEAECYVPTRPVDGFPTIPGGSWRRRVS